MEATLSFSLALIIVSNPIDEDEHMGEMVEQMFALIHLLLFYILCMVVLHLTILHLHPWVSVYNNYETIHSQC